MARATLSAEKVNEVQKQQDLALKRCEDELSLRGRNHEFALLQQESRLDQELSELLAERATEVREDAEELRRQADRKLCQRYTHNSKAISHCHSCVGCIRVRQALPHRIMCTYQGDIHPIRKKAIS
jgi:hypothetical protein